MILLNEEQVSAAIRSLLQKLSKSRRGKRKRMALYAEREFANSGIFNSELLPDGKGVLRLRATGRRGPDPVRPKRGGSRVGSEGLIAFTISQTKETFPEIIMNQPGPDLIRGKTNPAGSIVVVTDFVGSGSRVTKMLNAFWATPSVRAWFSRKYIDFKVVSAAGTENGINVVRRHRTRPEVHVHHIAPTIISNSDWRQADRWLSLMNKYGPDAGRGAGRYGFGGAAALMVFNYRLPNNTPAFIHKSEGSWKSLYDGAAPADLRPAFGMRTAEEVVEYAAEASGIAISPGLSPADAEMVLILSLVRGRWRWGTEYALAERTGLAVPDVFRLVAKALKQGLINRQGRLTDDGQALLAAGRKHERERPTVPTNDEPYYPLQLRTPRGTPSTSRLSGRP